MHDFKSKIAILRRLYSPRRYSTNPLEHASLQKAVVEGREKQFIPHIGFSDQSAWSKRCTDPRRFKEAELKIIANFFHLQDLAEAGEDAWRLLTDQYSYEEVTLRIARHGYGTLQSYGGLLPAPMGEAAKAADFLQPLLSIPASDLDIELIEVMQERGAAERDELQEQALLLRLSAGTPYAYAFDVGRKLVAFLYVLEISSDARGDRAACALIAPSRLHPTVDFINPAIVPETPYGAARRAYTMSDRYARCTTIGLVTEQPLTALPTPDADRSFAWLGVENVRLLARQLVDHAPRSEVFRGVCSLGLKA